MQVSSTPRPHTEGFGGRLLTLYPTYGITFFFPSYVRHNGGNFAVLSINSINFLNINSVANLLTKKCNVLCCCLALTFPAQFIS